VKENGRAEQRLAAPVRGLAQRFAYLGLILAAFALMLLGKADAVLMDRVRTHATDAMVPILDALSRPAATIADVVSQAQELVDLRSQNIDLRSDKERLLQWQDAARRLEAENQALRGMLNFQPAPEARFVTARVIGDTGGAFVHSVILNAGADAGVLRGQAAVTGAGLIGRVTHVGSRSARVLLLTDINSHIPVLIESTRTRAILAGTNRSHPRLIHLPPGAQVSPGQRVVTSGHAGVFPARLPVGVVAAVSDAGITIQPFVEASRLEYVVVVNYGLDGVLKLPQKSTLEAEKDGR
jgi:rod shape-determining protein MreC